MSGELKFSLGLVTGGFLSGLAGADARVKGFIGGLISLGAITRGVMGAIGEGADLERLHKRTGETVGDLVKIQEGFQAAGLSSEEAGSALFVMQKSLGGVDEMGKGTSKTFERMGLSMSKLKAMGAPEAMRQIVGALGKMNQSEAAKSASTIFGRGNAGNMMELARSTGAFAEGMAQAAGKAKLMQDNAASFQQLIITTRQIKDNVSEMFVGIAAGAAPAIQQVADMLKGVDIAGLGKGLGNYLSALVQAFKEGSLSELIGETFKTGFDLAVAFLPGMFEKMGYLLLKAFESPLNWLQAGITYTINQLANNPKLRNLMAVATAGASEAIGSALGLFGGSATFEDILKEQKEKGLGLNFGTGEFGLSDINDDSNQRLAEAKANMGKITAPLMEMIDGLVARAPAAKKSADILKGTAAESGAGSYKPEFTSLEKMGFVMSGLGNTDLAQRTANATERMAELMEQFIGGGEPVHEMA